MSSSCLQKVSLATHVYFWVNYIIINVCIWFVWCIDFLQADTASDWDALANRGNSNVTDTMSKWERDSLYVKFDPLVAAKKDSAPTQGQPDPFVFKAPKLPAPFHQPKLEHISESIANASDLSEANSSYQT